MTIEEIFSEIDIFNKTENNYDYKFPSIPMLSDASSIKSKEFLSKINSKYLDLISECYPSLNSTLCVDFEDGNNNELCLEIGKVECGYYIMNGLDIYGKCVDLLDITIENIDFAVKQIESDLLLTFKI